MGAEQVARALGGRRAGAGWIARCPAHVDRRPSLSIRTAESGMLLVHCFAGCHQRDVIDALRDRGLWSTGGARPNGQAVPPTPVDHRPDRTTADREVAAGRIWHAARPAAGTIVERYLRARGLTLPVPAVLRWHLRLRHPSGDTWPAMVALVQRSDGEPCGVHRTFIASDGCCKAPVEPQKMMLGPCRGGGVRLADPLDGCLMVGEGIESSLAVMQATGRPAWAALSTSGLRTLSLPDEVHEVIVLADGDAPGEAAARDAAVRWRCEGRRVRIARPPRGSDFNDVLRGGTDVARGIAT